jgi:hypothetical protein
MSKKRFSAGLDDLLQEELATHTEHAPVATAARPQERRTHSKNFMSGLDALLQEALHESMEKYQSDQPSASLPSGKSKTAPDTTAPRNPVGIDALIRQTMEVQSVTDEQTGVRRLTVMVDRQRLDKLKAIARLENSYLKDLMVGLIDEYIREYTQDKGIDL